MRIIDNKQVDLTDAEWQSYQDICKSYDSPTMEGRFLFQNLFISDDNGIIQTLLAPKKSISMEIVLFITSVMQQQHLRQMYRQLEEWKQQFQEQAKLHIESLADEMLREKKKLEEQYKLHKPIETELPQRPMPKRIL